MNLSPIYVVMKYLTDFPAYPSDYYGVLWALAGIRDLIILEHGASGTALYEEMTCKTMNRSKLLGKVYSTSMDDNDVIFGNEDKVTRAIKKIDTDIQPMVIALMDSPISATIGVDLERLASSVQPITKAKIWTFSGGGLTGDCNWGIKEVFRRIGEETEKNEDPPISRSVNIIGPAFDSYNYSSDITEISRLLHLLHVQINTIISRDTSIYEIRNITRASLNIVTRDIGIDLAKYLKNKYQMPYFYGMPFGIDGTISWLREISHILKFPYPIDLIEKQKKKYDIPFSLLNPWFEETRNIRTIICSHYDYALGLSLILTRDLNIPVLAIILTTKPENPSFELKFKAMGISIVLVNPTPQEQKELIQKLQPQIIFGNTYQHLMIPDAPLKIHVDIPSYNNLSLYDGTPFVGFRGGMFLKQIITNNMMQSREKYEL